MWVVVGVGGFVLVKYMMGKGKAATTANPMDANAQQAGLVSLMQSLIDSLGNGNNPGSTGTQPPPTVPGAPPPVKPPPKKKPPRGDGGGGNDQKGHHEGGGEGGRMGGGGGAVTDGISPPDWAKLNASYDAMTAAAGGNSAGADWWRAQDQAFFAGAHGTPPVTPKGPPGLRTIGGRQISGGGIIPRPPGTAPGFLGPPVQAPPGGVVVPAQRGASGPASRVRGPFPA